MTFFFLTVDHNGGGGAAPFGHDVAGDAGVVPRIRQASLLDDEIVVASGIDDAVRVQQLLIFQPLHLKSAEGKHTHTRVVSQRAKGLYVGINTLGR